MAEKHDKRELNRGERARPESLPDVGLPEQELRETELPERYGVDRIVALPVHPRLIHVYWEIGSAEWAGEKVGVREGEGEGEGAGVQPILRVYGLDAGGERPEEALASFDVEVDIGAGNWYVHLEESFAARAAVCVVELGARVGGGLFGPRLRSNPAHIPPSDLSSSEAGRTGTGGTATGWTETGRTDGATGDAIAADGGNDSACGGGRGSSTGRAVTTGAGGGEAAAGAGGAGREGQPSAGSSDQAAAEGELSARADEAFRAGLASSSWELQ